MLNASSNSCTSGRMLLPSRMPTRTVSEDESSSSSESPARSSRGRQLPLTPTSTFARQSNSSASEHTESCDALYSSQGSVDDDNNLDFSSLSEDLLQRMDPSNDDEDDAFFDDTRSEPLPARYSSSDRSVIHSGSNGHHRSSSVPARPLRSALAVSPPPSRASVSGQGGGKRARFDDDVSVTNVGLQRVISEVAPVGNHGASVISRLPQNVLKRDLSIYHASGSRETDIVVTREASEVVAALSAFEEIVEELAQVAEEHADAHEQLVKVAREVAEVIFDRDRRKEVDESDEDYDGEVSERCDDHSFHDKNDRNKYSFSAQSSADEDVDESCFEDAAVAFHEIDNEVFEKTLEPTETSQRPQPEVLFPTVSGEIRKPKLEAIREESNNSTETVIGPDSAATGFLPIRRISVPEARVTNAESLDDGRRRASMTDFTKSNGRFKLQPSSFKASPAGCAVTACSVRAAELPRLNTVYEHPSVRYRPLDAEEKHNKTAQTTRSNSGTFQMLWVEPSHSSSSSGVSLLESPSNGPEIIISEGDVESFMAPSPMDKVKTKLAVWSWAKEQELEADRARSNWLPLLQLDDDSFTMSGTYTLNTDEPYAPPNTERHSGASSAKHSAPHSPLPGASEIADVDDDDQDELPLELKAKPTLSRPHYISTGHADNLGNDYLSLAPEYSYSRSFPSSPGGARHSKAFSRQLSNLAAEEMHFKTHKDSLVLLHRRQDEGRMNQHLMNSRDSIVLTRSKFDDHYPKSAAEPKPLRTRVSSLTPIPDASPPNARVQAGVEAMVRLMDAGGCREHNPRAGVGDKARSEGACSMSNVRC